LAITATPKPVPEPVLELVFDYWFNVPTRSDTFNQETVYPQRKILPVSAVASTEADSRRAAGPLGSRK
jgi:hypothetical protein